MEWMVVILAAGQGTRMRSSRPKVLHELAGRPLIDHVLDVALGCASASAVAVVVGHRAEEVIDAVASRGVRTILQQPQLGTGHALATGVAALPPEPGAGIVVLSGDVPLLSSKAVRLLLDAVESGAEAALLTAVLDDPGAYGRVVRGADRSVCEVVEARDAAPQVLAIKEVNAGVYAFRRQTLTTALSSLTPDNAQGEYYLTDLIAAIRQLELPVAAVVLDDHREMIGINTRCDLAHAAKILNERALAALMNEGVTVIDPATTWVEPGCRIGRDVILEPGVVVRRGTVIGEDARIGAHSVLDGAVVAPGEAVPPLSHKAKAPDS